MNDTFTFIRIGNHIINKSDIVHVEFGQYSKYSETPNAPRIVVTLRSIQNYGDTSSASENLYFLLDSPEAQALLSWLEDNTQDMLPKEEKPSLSPETIAVAAKALRDYLQDQEIFRKDDSGSLAGTYELRKIMAAYREIQALGSTSPDYDLGDLDDRSF
jgi:hypothetical protein